MKAIDMILNILTEPDLPCDGRECNAECPFRFGSEMNPNSRSLCISWGDDENARREAMLQMLFDAVDEAREEDGIPKKGEMWKRIGADDCTAVTILSVGGRLKDRQEVKFAASRVAVTVLLESFLKAYEKVKEPAKPSHTTPNHYRLDPEPIDVIRGWDLGFCLGNVIKYLARAGHKAGESRDKDLHKAMEYLQMELEDE